MKADPDGINEGLVPSPQDYFYLLVYNITIEHIIGHDTSKY